MTSSNAKTDPGLGGARELFGAGSLLGYQVLVTTDQGGWYTPLSETHTYADWVVREKLPVILVVGIKLGCINHAMLTAEAVRARGLPLVGWIANTVEPPGKRYPEYLTSLKNRLPAPCLGTIPYLTDAALQASCGHYLTLPA